VRLLIADDSSLIRQGLVSLVTDAGHDVVAVAGDADQLAEAIAGLSRPPDLAILDIRMPPTHSDEGARAALELRLAHPNVGILLLSQHVEAHYALRLIRDHPIGFGYLLKDRILELDDLLNAIERIAAGGFVVDPDIVSQLLGRQANRSALRRLTPRETDILTLVAEGMSNAAISQRLRISGKTTENHISSIFTKLDLAESPADHRRVRAVLLFLGATQPLRPV
jgi:DNA-binding NarL/FixJ family response regulator